MEGVGDDEDSGDEWAVGNGFVKMNALVDGVGGLGEGVGDGEKDYYEAYVIMHEVD